MEDKLQEMVSTLGRLNWSFRDFVHAWAGAEGRARDAKLNHRIYLYIAVRSSMNVTANPARVPVLGRVIGFAVSGA